jgi:hypothetical protein
VLTVVTDNKTHPLTNNTQTKGASFVDEQLRVSTKTTQGCVQLARRSFVRLPLGNELGQGHGQHLALVAVQILLDALADLGQALTRHLL